MCGYNPMNTKSLQSGETTYLTRKKTAFRLKKREASDDAATEKGRSITRNADGACPQNRKGFAKGNVPSISRETHGFPYNALGKHQRSSNPKKESPPPLCTDPESGVESVLPSFPHRKVGSTPSHLSSLEAAEKRSNFWSRLLSPLSLLR